MANYATLMAEKKVTFESLQKVADDLNALKVLELFKRVSSEDAELLALQPGVGRPEDYIWQYISVPPPCIRPSVASDSGNNEDDLTAKLAEIVSHNKMLKVTMERGQGLDMILSNWEVLAQSVALYVNSQAPGLSAGGKPIRGLVQRLKGKQGRFRGNLSGKRVDFSARTVISPDPNLRIDEVAVPERVAIKLSYPERVTDHNIELMRQVVMHGARLHPGANVVEKTNAEGHTMRLGLIMVKDPERRKGIARDLQVGDVVHRHLRDGE